MLLFLVLVLFVPALAASPSDHTIMYDDIWNPPYGYMVEKIETVKITSEKVEGGVVVGDDELVLTQRNDGKFFATGIGQANVTLVNTSTNEKSSISITVKPAPLTIFFLTGQSNMEGSSSGFTGSHPENSILCPEGQVYSTYYPSSVSRFKSNTGINESIVFENRETAFVAGSLGSLSPAQNVDNEKLVYPLNALTAGRGKTGIDSGVAYAWNKETGDKVWIVNAAVSASDLATWTPDAVNFKRANTVFSTALKTAEAEVKAGHYILRHKLMLWLQGEASLDWWDYGYNNPSIEKYTTRFVDMYTGFKESLGLEKIGIIAVRGHFGNNRDTGETEMNCARAAQYIMCASDEYPDVYMVSNVNEQWVSDSGIKNYFKSAYPDGKLSYPLRSQSTLKLPTKIDEVHSDIHYAQVGHNENGITAAEGMLNVVNGKTMPTSVRWRSQDGSYITSLAASEKNTNLYYELNPIYAKGIKFSYNSSDLKYDAATGQLQAQKAGNLKFSALSSAGKALGEIGITYTAPDAPVLSSATNKADHILFSWKQVKNAKGYYVYHAYSGSGGWIRIGKISSDTNSFKDTDVSNGVKYIYTVRAYNDAGVSGYDKTGVDSCFLKQNTVKSKESKSAGKVTVKLTKNTKATGYQIQFATNSGFTENLVKKTVKDNTTTTITQGSLKKGKKYYIRVRSYKKIGSKNYYSAWKSGGSITTKK